ncbi:MAG: thermonuclease family protein [Cyclobacteriaceae bacterium]|nr:thermonuclease family protein [Cyclobacteriaceae bacterium]
MKVILALAFLINSTAAHSSIYGEEEPVKVIEVIDGNTLKVKTEAKDIFVIVLRGVDAPEVGQNYGDISKEAVEKRVLGKKVHLLSFGKDRFGNTLGEVRLKDGTWLHEELLKKGYVWKSISNNNSNHIQYELESRKNKMGLWSEENPTPPWIFKRHKTLTTAKSS